jgi:hypothetical protein
MKCDAGGGFQARERVLRGIGFGAKAIAASPAIDVRSRLPITRAGEMRS